MQVGDPFAEKVLIECCLEIFAADLVVGIQDLGAAGLSCATTELAAAGTGGMDVDLDLVAAARRDARARRDPDERVAGTHDGRRRRRRSSTTFLAVCAKWDVTATVIGTVTDTGRLRMRWHGEQIVDVPPRTAAHEGPVYEPPDRAPARPGRAQRRTTATACRGRAPATSCARPLLRLVASPNLADKSLGHRPVRPLRAGQHRARPARGRRHGPPRRVDARRGIALATDGNGRYTRLDPYAGAQLALAEAYRNVATTGARPLAVTNCLNFGSPEDPAVMWQFAEAVRGLADGCQELGIPVTGGNVSFYNQTGAHRRSCRRRWSACSA